MRACLATIALAGLSALVVGCGQAPADKKAEAPKAESPAETEAAPQPVEAVKAADAAKPADAANACADGNPRLKHTGLCQDQARGYLGASAIPAGQLPEDCDMVPNDASFGDGSEAILYMAMRCKGRVTQLEVRGGARSASIGYVTSGFFETIPADHEPVRVFPVAEGKDAKAMILEMARQTTEDKKEAAGCEIRDSAVDGYPAGSVVVDVTPAYRKANKVPPLPKDEPAEEAFCGQYGYASGGSQYWRIHSGFAWFHNFGQDVQDFDAATLVLMRKDAAGAWAVVK